MKKLKNITLLLSVIALLVGCGSDETQVEKVIRPVKSITVGGFSGASKKGYPAVTKENQETEISFRIGGPITKYNVVEGAKIEKGALIAEIDPRDYRLDVQAKKARYDQAKAESERYHRLWKKGSVAKNDYDKALANSLEAKSAWGDAKNALADTRLLAPYTGFFGPKLAQLGDKVQVREAITTLVDLSVLEVNTTIPEQLAVQFESFESYEVHFETYPDIVFNASFKQLEKKPTSEGFPLHLVLDSKNEKGEKYKEKVTAGMSCRVIISLKETENKDKSIVIPITSVFESDIDDSPIVWIIDEKSKTVKKQKVVIGDIVGNDAIKIKEGLVAGQQIVIAGVHRLTEGEEVTILK